MDITFCVFIKNITHNTKYLLHLETNIANLGSDLEKKVRQAAAETEAAWKNAGKAVGLQIWRIEKFQVKSWPKDQYGKSTFLITKRNNYDVK